MQVQVKLFGTFRRWLPAGAVAGVCRLQVPAGTMVQEVLTRLGLPLEEPDHLVILVNGRHASTDRVLQEGDVLSAFPAMEGG